MKQIKCCDICGAEDYVLYDYFALLCKDCIEQYSGNSMALIKRIGQLQNKIEYLEEKIKSDN